MTSPASTSQSTAFTPNAAPPHGRFVWYDLMTSDAEAAVRFYKAVAGWGTQQWDGPMPYTMWTVDGTTIGGIMPFGEQEKAAGIPPHWLASVCVRDADATAKQATELGATVVHGPMDIPNVGRYAVLRDPQGAMIAIFTPSGKAPGHEGMPKVGEFSWHELATTEHKAAFAFYSALFGWENTSSFDMGPMGEYLMYGQGEATYGGMMTKSPEMAFPSNWLCYIHVADINAAVETTRRLGGQVLNGPMEVPGGDVVAQCIDPQGAMFAVHGKKK